MSAFCLPIRRPSHQNRADSHVSFERAAAQDAWINALVSQGLAGFVRPERRLPADSLLPGHTPAHEARCAAVGNADMSTPISAMRTSAVVLPTPVMVINRRR